MKEEIDSAIDFLLGILKKRNLTSDELDNFEISLANILVSHYQDHWFPDKPYKGSAYRCMRIVNKQMDPLLARAGAQSGISESQLLRTLPPEFTMWVDPDEVSYRIGEDGSVGVIFDRQNGNHVSTGDVDIPSGSSTNSSPQSSRTPSPVVYNQPPPQQYMYGRQHQHHQDPRQSVDFFPGFHQSQYSPYRLQQRQHQSRSVESTCRDSYRASPVARGASQADVPTSWEYLAPYVTS